MDDHLVAETIRLNYQDFCALPDNGKRYEILDGELFMSPPPRTIHQRVVGRLYRLLADHVDRHALGEAFVAPFDVVLSEHDVVEPDLIFVGHARRSIITDTNIRGVPDLLVEVLFKSRPELDTRDKRAIYARCGVPSYWIVDPHARKLTELQLVGKAYAVVSEPTDQAVFRPRLFEELAIELAGLWS